MSDLSIDLSADGKRNAYALHCDKTGQRRNYAVCLHLCAERKKGRLSVTYSDCSASIGKKECPALKMRKQEIEAGHAIYFEERSVVVAGFIEKAKGFVGEVARTLGGAPKKPAKSPSIVDSIQSGTYADAINDALKERQESKTVAPAVKRAMPDTQARPGESLLDMARRLMGGVSHQ